MEVNVARTNRQNWITHDIERTAGAAAQRANITAGKAVATAVRTTLGPNGRDKMLIGTNGTVVITNNGASILDRVEIDDPTARVIINAATAQQKTVGDGVTTTVLLIGELLAKAEELLNDGLHPTTILAGYHQAVDHARKRLTEHSIEIEKTDTEALQAVARTTVTGKWDAASATRFASLAMNAIYAVEDDGRVDTRALNIKALPGGELRDSKLLDGLLVDMNTSSTTIEAFDVGIPHQLTDARLALVNQEITVETPDAVKNVTVSNSEQLTSFREYESGTRTNIVQKIIELNTDVLFCQKSIDDTIRTKLANEGILTVERTRQDEFDALVRATEATAVQSVESLSWEDIGIAGSVEQQSVGTTKLLIITDLPGDVQASLLLRGGTKHVAEETRRIIENCIATTRIAICQGRVLPGGGAIEMALARDLSAYAESISGREQLAVKAFAEALEGIPQALINNVGLDPTDAFPDLRNRHEKNPAVGIGSGTGELQDMVQTQVFEPLMVKERCLTSALETTAIVLRIDDIIRHTKSPTNDGIEDGNQESNYIQRSTDGYPWAIGH